MFPKTYLSAHVHSFIHGHPKQETAQMSISSSRSKQVAICANSRIPYRKEKGPLYNTCSEVGESHGFNPNTSPRGLRTLRFCSHEVRKQAKLVSGARQLWGVGSMVRSWKPSVSAGGLWLYQVCKWKKSLSFAICELYWV